MVTPALYALGVPMNIAVGTDLAHIVGKSLVSTFRHFRFGNVSLKIGLSMVPGTMLGVEIGARIMEHLKAQGAEAVDSTISLLYVILLGSLALFTFIESWRSRSALARESRAAHSPDGPALNHEVEDRVTADIAEWVETIRIPPMVSCRVAGVRQVSVWLVVLASIVTGLLAGLLGVGGGFLRMPTLVYVVGCPTHVAVGTDLFEIIISASYGTLTHALKGNVDLMMGLIMLVGATVGAQIGTFATRYVQGTEVRALFGLGILVAAMAVIAKTYLGMPGLAVALVMIMAAGMALTIVGYLVRGILLGRGAPEREEMAKRRDAAPPASQ